MAAKGKPAVKGTVEEEEGKTTMEPKEMKPEGSASEEAATTQKPQ